MTQNKYCSSIVSTAVTHLSTAVTLIYNWQIKTNFLSFFPSLTTELTGWVADALRLIAVSRHGLSTAEILKILPRLGYHGDAEVTQIDWAVFRCAALDSLFERPGGLLTFFHKHFKEAVEHTLLGKQSYVVVLLINVCWSIGCSTSREILLAVYKKILSQYEHTFLSQ